MNTQTALEFEQRSAYGKTRFYPLNALARALVSITGRKCLNVSEVELLSVAGFKVIQARPPTKSEVPNE